MSDAFQVSDSTLQSRIRIGFHSINNIYIRCIASYGHYLYDALAIWVRYIVHTDEGVTLLDQLLRCGSSHGTCEVLERHPRQPILTLTFCSDLFHQELVVLRDIMIIFL